MGQCLRWSRHLQAIYPLSQHHPWRPWHYPPRHAEQLRPQWVRRIQQCVSAHYGHLTGERGEDCAGPQNYLSAHRETWLNLSGIKQNDKAFLLDALLSPPRNQVSGTAGQGQPQPCTKASEARHLWGEVVYTFIIWCPLLFCALGGPFCQPRHSWCFRAQRFIAS